MDKIVFNSTSIFFKKYAIRIASVRNNPELHVDDIREIRLTRSPPEVVTTSGEVLYIPAFHHTHLNLFARYNNIPVIEKMDLWGLINEPFLDTSFEEHEHTRTMHLLAENGLSNAEVTSLRKRISGKMETYNSFLWEWVHLGSYDTLQAFGFDKLLSIKNRKLYDEINRISSLGTIIPTSQQNHQETARSKFLSLATEINLPYQNAEEIYKKMASHYNEPHRRYHNLEHILKVVEYCECLSAELEFEKTTPLRLAAWFHDIVYNPKSPSNEQDSANLMRSLLQEHISREILDQASDLIMLTTDHTKAETMEEKILADADLSTLAENTKEYQTYANAIREEYAHVEQEQFNQGRLQFIDTMLERIRQKNRLFHYLHPIHETLAAQNLQDEKEKLAG